MKKIFLYLTILMGLSISFILESCSTDSEATIENVPKSSEKVALISNYNSRSIRNMPANSANPFDYAGRTLYKQKSYILSQNLQKGSLTSRTKSSETYAPSSGKISPIAANYLLERIIDMDMTADAKLSFSRFIDSLSVLIKMEDRYETLYDFIVDYEASILIDDTISENDKEVILTNSSVIRYATYEEAITPPKNKDPDWTILFREVSSSKKVLAGGL